MKICIFPPILALACVAGMAFAQTAGTGSSGSGASSSGGSGGSVSGSSGGGSVSGSTSASSSSAGAGNAAASTPAATYSPNDPNNNHKKMNLDDKVVTSGEAQMRRDQARAEAAQKAAEARAKPSQVMIQKGVQRNNAVKNAQAERDQSKTPAP